jgi:hypothetical protein
VTGNNLHLHPAVVVAGDFDEPVRAWEGIPQTYECTEFLDLDSETGHRAWIVPAFAHPIGTATMVPGHGELHRALLERYEHLAVLTAMIHDRTKARSSPTGTTGSRSAIGRTTRTAASWRWGSTRARSCSLLQAPARW